MKLFVQYIVIDVRKFFFSNGVVLPWNSLNPHAVDLPNLRCFKQLLDKTDFNELIHFCLFGAFNFRVYS